MKALGGEIVGVSADEHERQCDFAASVNASFPMIGDSDHRIASAYGVVWPLLGIDRRVTFFIDREGIVRGVFKHELDVRKHVAEALEMLRKLNTP